MVNSYLLMLAVVVLDLRKHFLNVIMRLQQIHPVVLVMLL